MLLRYAYAHALQLVKQDGCYRMLQHKSAHSIKARVALAEQSLACPVRAQTVLRFLQKYWPGALPESVTVCTKQQWRS